MTLQAVIFVFVVIAAAGAIYWLWWRLPKHFAARDLARRTAKQKREDYYRLQVSKALGGLLALGAFVVTVEQTVATQMAAVAARVRANELTGYDHYQKALESLIKPGHVEVVHVGAIYALGTIANENPELGKTIATELALTALSSPPAGRASPTGGSLGPPPNEAAELNPNAISMEAQFALRVLGSLSVMHAGMPLQLAEGKFRGANLPEAVLNGIQLPRADLSGSDLYHAQLFGANFRGAELSGANLTQATLTRAGFYGAILCEAPNSLVALLNTGSPVGVQLSGATVDQADFERAWLIGALLATNLDDSSGTRTNLSYASFRDASLKGADLSHSMLDHANFDGADLTGANLNGASHMGIQMNGARLCRTTMFDGSVKSECPAWDVKPDLNGEMKGRERGRDCVKGKTWRELEAAR